MIQLVKLVTVDNEDLAYHYGSDNIDEVFEHERLFNEWIKDTPLSFSSHILATEDASFDSLCGKDPYFKQFIEYHDLKLFIEEVKEKVWTTDEKADYLKSLKRLVPVFALTERVFNAIRLFGMIDL